MNTSEIKENLQQFVGRAKEKRSLLTDDDWKVIEGRRDQLPGRLQLRYGMAREEAERQIAGFERS